ncbi:MAG TPA: cellulase family glycosylhydrolase, partial [Povalibacter sp.]
MTIALQRFARWLLLSLALMFTSTAAMAGFFIQNGQLLDANGTPFVMRGINYPYTWYQSRPTQQDFAAMAATGANTVRIVLSTGGQWARVNGSQVSQLIQWSKDNKMIAVLEVHDSTGWSEQTTAVPISNAVAYWTSSDIRAAINGQENFVIVNIANEPFGNTTTASYLPDTIAAIQALRTAGLTHTLMIDGATWGQDWSNTMRTNAQQLWTADSLRNLLFSVHMYEVYQSSSPIMAYMQAFDDMGLPLVIGEFGPQNNGQPVDVETIFSQAQQRANGYIGWSWSGNGSGGVSLDMVSNFSTTFTSWGERIVNGANGIRQTSVLATVFGTTTPTLNVSPTTVSLAAAASSAAVSVTANLNWSVTDNASWLTVSPTSGANNGSFTVSATANTSTSSRSATVTVTGGSLTRTITVTQAGAAAQDFSILPASGTVTVNRGANAGTSINVSRTGSFTGSVAFSASGLPSGVTATFNPTSTTGNSSVLTFAASSSATLGTSTVTVTGTSGSLVRTTQLVLTVNSGGTGDFGVSVSPSSLSVIRGASGTASIAFARVNGFTSSIACSASGLPSGVTASFSPSSTTGNSITLTLAASSTATLGSATVGVSCTGGSLTRATNIALTVNSSG